MRDPTETKNTNQNGDIVPAPRNRLRDLPVCSEEFTENLEDQEVPIFMDTSANTAQDSDSQRPAKVVIEEAHYLYLLPEKTEIAKHARKTKLQVLLAGSALAMQYF